MSECVIGMLTRIPGARIVLNPADLGTITWILYHARHGFIHQLLNRKRQSSQKNDNEHLVALTATLDDFQKRQGLFVAAVQVTTRFALFNAAPLLAAMSSAQLAYDANFACLSTLTGMSSVYLVYTLLRSARPGSIFTSMSTMITLPLCVITLLMATNMTSSGDMNDLAHNHLALEACGGISPTMECGFSNELGVNLSGPVIAWAFVPSLLAVPLVLFDTIFFRQKTWSSSGWILFLQLHPVGVILNWIICYSAILASKPGTLVEQSEWSLSQILAVTIWFPAMAECVSYNSRKSSSHLLCMRAIRLVLTIAVGIEETAERWLVEPYKVIQQTDDESSLVEAREEGQSAGQVTARASIDDTASIVSRGEPAKVPPYFQVRDVT